MSNATAKVGQGVKSSAVQQRATREQADRWRCHLIRERVIIPQHQLPGQLASLAYSIANLEMAMETAAGCHDYEWMDDNREILEKMHLRMANLKAQASVAEIREAQRLTNAKI